MAVFDITDGDESQEYVDASLTKYKTLVWPGDCESDTLVSAAGKCNLKARAFKY